MDYLLAKEHWASLVRDFKDAEREYDIPAYNSECLARDILGAVRGRIRQLKLFREHRGEEYETMLKKLNELYDPTSVKRILEDEEFWEATFTLRVV